MMNLRPALLGLVCLALASCDRPHQEAALPRPDTTAAAQPVCTMEFRTAGLTVLGEDGQPAPDVTLDVIRASDGGSILCEREEDTGCVAPLAFPQTPGHYTIFSDAVEAASEGERFRVVGTRAGTRFEEAFTFAHDGCHFEKVAGPDTVRLIR